MDVSRKQAVGSLLVLFLVLSYVVLAAVIHAIVFAITIAYVLYPIREYFRKHGLSNRLASGLTTLLVFLILIVLVIPVMFTLYQRRDVFLDNLAQLPETYLIEFVGMSYEVDVMAWVDEIVAALQALALDMAMSAPGFVLALLLFTFVLYGVLCRPQAVRGAIYGAVPHEHHDIVDRLHSRTRRVLFALYVIQAVTAAATFVIALVLFVALGYSAPIWLAFLAGILQFIPMVGPSILVGGLAIVDFAVFDEPMRAVLVLIFGLLFISLLPDATIRPRLAARAGDFSQTLYFVGFVGGLLTLGAIGVIVGPLVVALLVETVAILAADNRAESAEQAAQSEASGAATGGRSAGNQSTATGDPDTDS